MTNAWIQRLLTLGVPATCWAIGYQYWSSYQIASILWFVAPILIGPTLLGMQFIALVVVNRVDLTPRASVIGHIQAWWGELYATIKVFSWWQPFRRDALSDRLIATPGQRGVVLVHGFFCNRGFWTHWMRRLSSEGRVFVSVDLVPAFESIDGYSAIIDQAVSQVRDATGLPPVLVGHSMGGLAIRMWLAAYAAKATNTDQVSAPVHRVITLGTPHHGTWLAGFSHTVNGSQMRLQSDWLNALKDIEKTQNKVEFVCFYSNCDNIVFPVSSAKREEADNRLVRSLGHVGMAHDPEVIKACWELMR